MITGAFSAQEILHLRELWDEGVSTIAIGRRMDRSTDSVSNKAYRLGLQPRPSPIKRPTPGAATILERNELGHTIWTPHLEDIRARVASGESCVVIARFYGCSRSTVADQLARMGIKAVSVMERPAVLEVMAPVYVPPYMPPRTSAAKKCQFPLWGNLKKPTHRYCGEASVSGRSYCGEHLRVCCPTYRVASEPEALAFEQVAA